MRNFNEVPAYRQLKLFQTQIQTQKRSQKLASDLGKDGKALNALFRKRGAGNWELGTGISWQLAVDFKSDSESESASDTRRVHEHLNDNPSCESSESQSEFFQGAGIRNQGTGISWQLAVGGRF